MVGHGLRRIAKSANPQPCSIVLTAPTTLSSCHRHTVMESRQGDLPILREQTTRAKTANPLAISSHLYL